MEHRHRGCTRDRDRPEQTRAREVLAGEDRPEHVGGVGEGTARQHPGPRDGVINGRERRDPERDVPRSQTAGEIGDGRLGGVVGAEPACGDLLGGRERGGTEDDPPRSDQPSAGPRREHVQSGRSEGTTLTTRPRLPVLNATIPAARA